MRHNRQTNRLGRNWSKRKALLESLVSSLLTYQEIKTTLPKAKEAKRLADRIITLGKEDSLSARRQVFSYLQNHSLTSKLFKEVAPRFKSRNGGYTRILHLSRRKGDGAQLALLELTEKEIKVKETKKSKKKSQAQEQSSKETQETKGHPEAGKETHFQKEAPHKQEKPKTSFFKNIGKFFKNKGGGG